MSWWRPGAAALLDHAASPGSAGEPPRGLAIPVTPEPAFLTCQWIADEPDPDDACKCGLPVAPGQPWCARHLARVYEPPTPETCVWRLVFGPTRSVCAAAGAYCPACRPRPRPRPGPPGNNSVDRRPAIGKDARGTASLERRACSRTRAMTVDIPFVRDLDFEYGVSQELSPLIRRVVARNPSPFTFHGTGTYIVGRGEVAVIDPGPDLPDHVEAVRAAVEGERVTHLLITHTHRDHSPAAKQLKAATGAPTYGFGPHGSGRAESSDPVEEGADREFEPDVVVRDGDVIEGAGWRFEAVWTPGHTSNHLCFALPQEKVLFSGDHVMGWSTSVVSPPDGDMRAYMASLRRLLERDDQVYWPTHGPAIRSPRPFVEAFIAHREDRERQIADCLASGRVTIPAMVEVMYAEVPRRLHPAAARSVLAHLVHMVETGRVSCEGPPREGATYALAGEAPGAGG